jgi:hypothetical protein
VAGSILKAGVSSILVLNAAERGSRKSRRRRLKAGELESVHA